VTRQTGPDAATRATVYARDDYRCCRCSSTDGPFAIHHRSGRRAGGSRLPEKNALSNLVLVDDRCHTFLESRRMVGAGEGFIVPSWHDPAETPLLYRGRWVLLADDGSVENVEVAS
jgi:hypothetical protein